MIIYSKWNEVCPEDRLRKWKLMLTRVWGRSINNWILLLQQKSSYAKYMQMCPQHPYGGPKEVWETETLSRALDSDLALCGRAQIAVALKSRDSINLLFGHI